MLTFLEPSIQSTRLSREAFATALRHGRGSAVMHVRDHGLDGVEDLVLAACLEDQCYDRQCEGSRADWMYGLFKHTPAYARFAGPILESLSRCINDDDYDAQQVRQLVGLMACDGDLAAAACLRTFVQAQEFTNDGLPGASAVCALDGMSAVVDIARRVGHVLQQDPQAWIHPLESLTGGALSFEDAFAELKRMAHADPAIAAYVARQEALIARDAPDQRSDLERAADIERYCQNFIRQNPVESIIAASAGESNGRSLFLRFGQCAPDHDLELILDHLRTQSDPDVCTKLLWVFRRATLPRLDEHVWALASHGSADVRNAAVVALSSLNDPRVRALGLERLAAPDFSSEFSKELSLFERNFEPGDEVPILAALERQAVEGDAAHHLGSEALDVCSSVDSPVLAGVAQWVYHTNPCTLCRCRAVERLLEWRCLPAHIAQEGSFDASEELRELLCRQP